MALTIGQAKELGIEFIVGDKRTFCESNGGKGLPAVSLNSALAEAHNKDNVEEDILNMEVVEFAWRDKSTLLEITRDLEVELLTVNHDIITLDLPQAIWIIPEITHWRPSLEQKARTCGCEEDSTELKAGTLAHCYEALDGDLCNVSNFPSSGVLRDDSVCVLYKANKYYVSSTFYGLGGWIKVCTIEEFNYYKLKQENPPTNEKTIWTTEMVECAVELQVGMTCLYGDLEVEVIFTGDHLVMVRDVNKREFAVSYLSLSPIETRTKEDLQLDSLVEFMHENNQLTNVELAEALQENGFLKEV